MSFESYLSKNLSKSDFIELIREELDYVISYGELTPVIELYIEYVVNELGIDNAIEELPMFSREFLESYIKE